MNQDTHSAVVRIRTFIEENFLFGQNTLKDSDSFLDSGILDSTGVLQLIAFLYEAYGVTVADEEMIPDNLDSIEKVAAYLDRKFKRPSAVDDHLQGEQAR